MLTVEYNPELLSFAVRCALFPLPGGSLGERVRVRGNGAHHPFKYQIIPETVELHRSCGEALGFPQC